MLPGTSPVSPSAIATQRLSQTAQDVDNNSSSLASLRPQQQVDRALEQDVASRSVSPAANKPLHLVGEGRTTNLPAATGLSLCAQSRLDRVTQEVMDYLAELPGPPHREWTTLSYFLMEEASSAQRLGQHDLFAALAEQQDSEGHSFLYLAVSKGEIWLVEWLLNTKPATFSVTDPFTGKNDEKTNPLHAAVEKRYSAVVASLLERKADINIVNSLGQTPLHVAVQREDGNMVALLLKNGADTQIVNGLGHIPLQVAINSRCKLTVCLLLEHNRDISFRDRIGRTPLHWAVERGDDGMVSLLLEKNADVNAVDAMRRTPLHLAARYNYEDIAMLLLERGADTFFHDEIGKTPLYWAHCQHEDGVIKQLIREQRRAAGLMK